MSHFIRENNIVGNKLFETADTFLKHKQFAKWEDISFIMLLQKRGSNFGKVILLTISFKYKFFFYIFMKVSRSYISKFISNTTKCIKNTFKISENTIKIKITNLERRKWAFGSGTFFLNSHFDFVFHNEFREVNFTYLFSRNVKKDKLYIKTRQEMKNKNELIITLLHYGLWSIMYKIFCCVRSAIINFLTTCI